MIPDRLIDKTLYTSGQAYPLCILIRIILGIVIYFRCFSDSAICKTCITIILAFMYKFSKVGNTTWKVHLRTIALYSSILTITAADKKSKYNAAGLLAIVDAVDGLQTKLLCGKFLN